MAFYVYAWRDVRDVGAAVPVGTKDVPRTESTVKKFFIEKLSDPVAADLVTPLRTAFPSKTATDATWAAATATAAAAANEHFARGNETTTVTSFRHGKQFLQFGCGTGLSATSALGAINWKDL